MPRLGICSLVLVVSSLFASFASAQPIKRTDLKPGLVFTVRDLSGKHEPATLSRLEPGVALNLAAGESAHPLSNGGAVFTWTGHLNVLTPGKYSFDAMLAGTVEAKVGEKVVLNAAVKSDQAAKVTAETIDLAAGIQPFVVTLTRGSNQRAVRLELFWKGPDFQREPIPSISVGHLPKQRPASFAADLARDHGRLLFEELSCVRCHQPDAKDAAAKSLVERTGPNLTEVGRRAYPGWLDAWLADPQKVRPHTVMPKMFTDDATGKAERYAVVAYLSSLGGPVPRAQATDPRQLSKSVGDGRKLFLTAGCAACHGDKLSGPPSTAKKNDDPDADLKPELMPEDSIYSVGTTNLKGLYTLGGVGSKWTADGVAKFLQNPLATNPHGRMPNMLLNGQEAQDLARFLTTEIDRNITREMPDAPDLEPSDVLPKKDRAAVAKLKPADQWKEVGKRLLTLKGCVNCHAVAPGGTKLPTIAAATLTDIRKADATGCLAPKPTPEKNPVFHLDAKQKVALAAFLKGGLAAATPAPAFQAKLAVRRFQCLNCHQRDGEGGLDLALTDVMKQLEKAENADDVAPPRLTAVGHKLRTTWLTEVLTRGGRARPWMTLRMPQYGEGNVAFLAHALPKLEGTIVDDAIGKVAFDAAKIETGRTLVGKAGHGCVACHDISGVQTGGTRGPDLATTSKRVRYDWYVHWMHQPQRLAPGTRMPQYFPDGKALLTTILKGDADAQIGAMWAYMSLGPGLPLPFGLEPPKGLVIAVKDRPEILRTFMPDGAGTKAIAVGYPNGLSAVFDGATCRLSYAWTGNFLDASPVWNNRGGAPAKLLGPKFWTGPNGFPWAVSDSRTPPDFSKRGDDPAYGHPLPEDRFYGGPRLVHFAGYALDAAGQPTFRYTMTDKGDATLLVVAEKPEPLPITVAAGLKRTFAVDVPADKSAWLHVGTATREPRVLAPSGAKLDVDLKAADAEAPAVGSRVILPTDGDKVTVFEVGAAPAGTAWRFVPKSGGGWDVMLRLPESDKPAKAELTLLTWGLPRDDEELLKGLRGK